ncbi:hypothetical protein F4802DRAFT_100338 [Xylaria palmicola]|nr:hypothetical protein F4802DRAFT_100338 [Xylaria palmicola]
MKFAKFGKSAITKPLYLYETWLRLVGRGLQLVFALVVIGLYGTRVREDRSEGHHQAVQWLYALTVGGLSALTAILFAIPQPFVRTARLFAWDLVMFVLWIAAFGTFAVIFLRMPDDDAHKWYQGTRVSTMRSAVWIDLVNAIFWLLTGLYGCFRTFVSRKVDEKIDSKLEQLGDHVSDKLGGQFENVDLGSKVGAAANIASKFAPKIGPKMTKFREGSMV